jgi:NADH-quinone oxidoreductase subunit N
VTGPALAALAPLVVIGIVVIALLLVISIRRGHGLTAVLTMAGIAVAFAALFHPGLRRPVSSEALLVFDDSARLYTGLILAGAAAVVLLSFGYFGREGARPDGARRGPREEYQPEEYYVLLLLASFGSIVLVAAVHFSSIFLGLEILSVSLYGLIAYPRDVPSAIEAGIKYLVLAAVSAAFLLFGMALVYAETGTLTLAGMTAVPGNVSNRVVWLVGVGLIVTGFGFKLALVPFHLWTPDVYQGAPAPVTAFVATVSKGAMLALLVRVFARVDVAAQEGLFVSFAVLAVASMAAGNLLALLQDNVKRMLAYSSIAHLGYLLVAFLASGGLAATAVAFYLVAYFVAMIGAFGVVAVLSGGEREAEHLDDYRGLFARRPWLAGLFTGMLLSLAGIPLTAGFVGKFVVTVAAGSAALWALLIVMMVTSGVGLFYYLRVVVAMFMQPAAVEAPEEGALPVPLTATLTLAMLAAVLLGLGVFPGPLLAVIDAAVARG